jgi:O-antigen/teichoic acid export membrane protein
MSAPLAPSPPMPVSSAALLTLASQIVQLAAALATAVLVARLLGPAGKGVVSLVVLSGALAVTFGGLGVPIYHGCVAGRGEFSRGALRANALVCATPGSVVVGAAGILSWCAGVAPISGSQLAWLLAVVPVGIVLKNVAGIFHGEGRFREYNILPAIMWMTTVGATAAFVLAFGGVGAALAAWWLGHAVAGTLGWWLSRDERPAWNPQLLRASLRFGVLVWFVQLIGEGNLRFDTYVAALVEGAEGAGFYSVAVSITNLLFYVPAAIGTGALPRLASSSVDEAARLAGAGCRISLWSSALLAVAVAVCARPVIHALFGPAFEPAVVPLLLLLPGVVIYAMAHVTTSYFYGQLGRPMLNGLVALVSLLVGIVLSTLLARSYGLAGVAGGVTIGRVVAMGVNLWLFTRLSRCSLADLLLPRPGDAALLLTPFRRLWPETKAA